MIDIRYAIWSPKSGNVGKALANDEKMKMRQTGNIVCAITIRETLSLILDSQAAGREKAVTRDSCLLSRTCGTKWEKLRTVTKYSLTLSKDNVKVST